MKNSFQIKNTVFVTLTFLILLILPYSCKDDFKIEEAEKVTTSLEPRACTTGTVSSSFNGVSAYTNCPIGSATTYGDSYYGGIYVGKKWQCVEYVQRYYKAIYNMNIKPAFGNANTYYTNSNHSTVGLQKFVNGSVVPQVGDILVSTGGAYGHVAIIRSVSSSSIGIIDQNFSAVSARSLTRSGNTIGSFSSGYNVAGIVRKMSKAETPKLISPAHQTSNLLAPLKFTWSCPNGTEYRIQIIEARKMTAFSKTTGFSGTMAYNNNIGNTTSFTWTSAPRGTLFYWTIRANNSAGASEFSQYYAFSTAK
jgi:surface antigen